MDWFTRQTSVVKMTIVFSGLLLSLCMLSYGLSIVAPVSNSFTQVAPATSTTAINREKGIAVTAATPTPIAIVLNCQGAGGTQPNGQSFTDFCALDTYVGTVGLEHLLSGTCDLKRTAMCDINVWLGNADLPSAYPLTDDQLLSRLAQYKRNMNTGYECFMQYDDAGGVLYASDGCK